MFQWGLSQWSIWRCNEALKYSSPGRWECWLLQYLTSLMLDSWMPTLNNGRKSRAFPRPPFLLVCRMPWHQRAFETFSCFSHTWWWLTGDLQLAWNSRLPRSWSYRSLQWCWIPWRVVLQSSDGCQAVKWDGNFCIPVVQSFYHQNHQQGSKKRLFRDLIFWTCFVCAWALTTSVALLASMEYLLW